LKPSKRLQNTGHAISGNNTRRLRPLRLIATLGALAVAALAAAPAANAGTYHLVACQSANQASPGFAYARNTALYNAPNTCGSTDGYMRGHDDGSSSVIAQGKYVDWAFSAPTGTLIAGVSLRGWLEEHHGNQASVRMGNGTGSVSFGVGTATGGWVDYTSASGAWEKVYSHLECTSPLNCTNDGTSETRIKMLDIELNDTNAPVAVATGTLVGGGTLGGSKSVTVSARDRASDSATAAARGGGVQTVSVKVDGTVVNTTSGGTSGKGQNDYTSSCNLVSGGSLRAKAAVPCALDRSETYDIDTHQFSNGTHTVQICTTDFAGSVSGNQTCTSHSTINVSNVEPQTTITGGPTQGSYTQSTSASFSFTSSKTPSTFECQLDGGAWSACTSPKSYSSLPDGSHTFCVKATDVDSNTDPTRACRTWTIDNVAPDTTIVIKPDDPSASPVAQFTFTSSQSGSTFECQIDGGAWLGCGSPKAYTLGSGQHTFNVRATDPAGNLDASPASYTWTITPVSDCEDADVTAADGFAGPAYVKLRAKRGAFGNPDATVVCYRINAGSGLYAGGYITITAPSASPQVPTIDDQGDACENNGGAHLVGPGALGDPGDPTTYVDYQVDTYSASGVTWVCVKAKGFSKRVVVDVGSSSTPDIRHESDNPQIPNPSPESSTNAAYASSTCQNSGGTLLANAEAASDSHIWIYERQPNSSKAQLCIRVEGPVRAGGMLELDALAGVGVTPVIQTGTDMTPCPIQVATNGNPVQFTIKRTDVGVNPASICVTSSTANVTRSFTLGAASSGSPGIAKWTPDPDTPVGPLP
jgi:hypothetical protein